MPRRIQLAIGLVGAGLCGALIGLAGFTFVYADGAAYLHDDPAACANCHVMQGQYEGWRKSSHHAVATCNDCHTPHSFFGKYYIKARNGYHHSLAFTTMDFHEPIQITPINRDVTEGACRACHAAIVQQIDSHGSAGGEAISCLRCHRNVGHLH